ncbi:flagellin [Paracoccaceae bacterium GXU_MW_L88]
MFSVSNLSQSLSLKANMRFTNQEMKKAGYEITTGLAENKLAHLKGDVSHLYAVERNLRAWEVQEKNLQLSVGRGNATVSALEAINGLVGDFPAEITDAAGKNFHELKLKLVTAEGRFEDAVRHLNSSYAGQSLFSGAATDRPAIADHENIMTDLSVAVAAATTAADVENAVESYFAPGGAFETSRYLGSEISAPDARVSDQTEVEVSTRAIDPAIVGVLKNFAKLNLVSQGATSLSQDEQKKLAANASMDLLESGSKLTERTAAIGYNLARVEERSIALASQRTVLQMEKNNLIGVDQYEAASRYEHLQTQLQATYQITTRLSRLNLFSHLS